MGDPWGDLNALEDTSEQLQHIPKITLILPLDQPTLTQKR